MTKYVVYIHVNIANDMKYVGITKQKPERRWRKGEGYKSNLYFYNAIQKYGWDNFKHEVLFCNLTKEQAEMFEIELIKYYKSNNPNFGYNIENGGNSIGKISDKTKEKLRQINLGKASPMKGKKHTQEARLKMSINHANVKGENNPMYNTISPMRGKKHSKETRRKMSISNLGKVRRTRSVVCIETGKIYKTIKSAGEELNIPPVGIGYVCRGKLKTTRGYTFKYYEEDNK